MEISIKHIAEKSGLSRMTVWRALNGRDGSKVSPETQEKIMKAMAELRSTPVSLESRLNLPQKNKKRIIMLSPCSNDAQLFDRDQKRHFKFFNAAMQKAADKGYVLEVIPVSHKNSSTNIAWELFDDVGPESLILGCDSWYMFTLMELARRGARIALIMADVFWSEIFKPQMKDWVTCLYNIGGRSLIEYYLKQGCTRIARAVWEDYMNEPNYPGICDYDDALSAAGNDYRHIIPLSSRISFQESILKAYREKTFDALVFNHGGYDVESQMSLQSLLGLPETVRLGQAMSSHPEKSFNCRIDRLAFDWEQIIEDAIQALTADYFIPNQRKYSGELIPTQEYSTVNTFIQ